MPATSLYIDQWPIGAAVGSGRLLYTGQRNHCEWMFENGLTPGKDDMLIMWKPLNVKLFISPQKYTGISIQKYTYAVSVFIMMVSVINVCPLTSLQVRNYFF